MADFLSSIPTGFPTSFPNPFLNGEDEQSSTLTTSTTKTIIPAAMTSQTTPPGLQTTMTTSTTSSYYYPTHTGYPDKNHDGFFDRLESGTKAGMGIAIAFGILIIVIVSTWYCCGCCGLRARRRKRREGTRAPDINTQRPVPLNTMNSNTAPPPAGDAPPQYEEAVPPRHQHIAGGARYIREDEEEGVISDGKTPLSEIPFEDVVLDHSPSEGSSRSFSERHHGLGGDTTGHTNT
ncbi:hypothetical protein DL95DRAFT_96569 [Leptodontidium sp. 2 PMI_412]|nr:hypothetical protein BKA61DRAFT_568784 [Leptodontidium sp. MPI-SDFR-AT-0119]KAH9223444.1 hypothetical protein DL95DRAFT_96569 [Leptodontidium sp. 2 PMI_412]